MVVVVMCYSPQCCCHDHCRLLEELYLSEKRYGELLKMFLSERHEQSQHLADQLGVPLPPLGVGAATTPAGKRLCQEQGSADHSTASTVDSTCSATTVTAEVSYPLTCCLATPTLLTQHIRSPHHRHTTALTFSSSDLASQYW